LGNNEFQLCLDSAAFDFQVLNATRKIVRVSVLDHSGRWQRAEDSDYSEAFQNDYFRIDPIKRELVVFKSTTFLYLNPRVPPKRILCEVSGRPEVYIDMHLLKQPLKHGSYKLLHDSLLHTPEGLMLVSFPEQEGSRRPNVAEIYDQSLLPLYNFFASTQLK